MSNEVGIVNGFDANDYEVAYRILLLLNAATRDRHEGVFLVPSLFYKVIGAPQDTAERAYQMLIDDGLISESKDGTIWIG